MDEREREKVQTKRTVAMYISKRIDTHLEELVNEELDALDSGIIATIDLGRLPSGLLDEQADERVAPITELHRVTLALAGVVVGGLYGLIVRHILDHHTGTGDSGGLPHGLPIFISLCLSFTLLIFLLSLFLSLRSKRSFYHSEFRAARADTPEMMDAAVERTIVYLSLAAHYYATTGHTAHTCLSCLPPQCCTATLHLRACTLCRRACALLRRAEAALRDRAPLRLLT